MLYEKNRYTCFWNIFVRRRLKTRAITSNESFWRSESPASRFHSKKRLAFYPSISRSKVGERRERGKDAGDEKEDVKKHRQETVDFRTYSNETASDFRR